MAVLSKPAVRNAIHAVLDQQLRECLRDPGVGHDLESCAVALAARPGQLLRLLEVVDGTYSENDHFLERTLSALDRSCEEARELHREEAARSCRLEAVLVERERAIAELEAARLSLTSQEKLASIGTLAAGIAHEINTPTQYVSDNLFFLKDAFGELLRHIDSLGGAAGPAAAPEEGRGPDLDFLRAEIPAALKQAAEGLDRVANIVRSVKDFSHPGTACPMAVDLNRAVESTLTVCRNEWKYVAEVETRLDPALPTVSCVPGEINQVLLNLVVNAAQAVEDRRVRDPQAPSGHIVVASSVEEGWATVTISDNGCGIPKEIAGRIFDPFFTTKEVGRGSGQGLAIARTVVVEKHKGSLDFESVPNQGTVFRLRLPVAGARP